MHFRNATTRTPIGLDLGSGAVKAVQLARANPAGGGGAWRIAAATVWRRATREPTPAPAEMQRVADLLDRQGFTGADVVLAAPHAMLMTAVLELPPRRTGAPLEQLARMELAQSNRRDPESFEMAMWDLPTPARAADATHVITAACPHTDADALLDAVEAAGLRVAALDVHAWAAARAVAPAVDERLGITAVLDLGWSGSLLVLLHRGVVVYERVLNDAGCGKLLASLKQELDLEDEAAHYLFTEAGLEPRDGPADAEPRLAADARKRVENHFAKLTDELRASVSYAEHQYPDQPLGQMLVIGAGAAVPGLAGWLGNVLQTPARSVAPADLYTCDPSLRVGADPTATLAAGLALHGEGAA